MALVKKRLWRDAHAPPQARHTQIATSLKPLISCYAATLSARGGGGNYLLFIWQAAGAFDFPHESEYEEGMLTFRQFLATIMGLAVAALLAGCKRGEPVKTLLLHDSGGARPRRFDDVRILGTKSDYVKFRTGSGEVIEFSGKYEIKQ